MIKNKIPRLRILLVSSLLWILFSPVADVIAQSGTYEVQRGDTLTRIARQLGVTTEELAAVNNIANPNTIFIGQILVVPGSGTTSSASGPSHQVIRHTVQSGDSLYRLASRYGVAVAAIQQANSLSGAVIFIGQVLTIPGAGISTEVVAMPVSTSTALSSVTSGVQVPAGFAVSLIAQLPDEMTPTSMTYGPDGRLYVAAMPNPFADDTRIGAIYVFSNGNASIYASDFLMPAGLVFQPKTGALFVAHRASDAEGQISIVPPGGGPWSTFLDGLPCCYTLREHQPAGMAFGPDGYLYVGIGARSDHGPDPAAGITEEIHPYEAGILRISPDGTTIEKYADGLRNPYDIAFDSSGVIWTADNGPDYGPPELLQRVIEGGHYGFPYYADCGVCDVQPAGLEIIPPVTEFAPHATPAGLTVYSGSQFPSAYLDSVLVTLWNPHVTPGVWRYSNGTLSAFVTGLATPVDVVVAPDGTVAVADFFTGAIYSVRWAGG